jgi:Flp pilus assembly protein TadG
MRVPVHPRKQSDLGAATAEFAIILPILLAFMLLAFWVVGAVVANIRCIDAARDVARALARGEPPEAAHLVGQRAAPRNATITITRTDDDIEVAVTSSTSHPSLLSNALPTISAKGHATVQAEPGPTNAGDHSGP